MATQGTVSVSGNANTLTGWAAFMQPPEKGLDRYKDEVNLLAVEITSLNIEGCSLWQRWQILAKGVDFYVREAILVPLFYIAESLVRGVTALLRFSIAGEEIKTFGISVICYVKNAIFLPFFILASTIRPATYHTLMSVNPSVYKQDMDQLLEENKSLREELSSAIQSAQRQRSNLQAANAQRQATSAAQQIRAPAHQPTHQPARGVTFAAANSNTQMQNVQLQAPPPGAQSIRRTSISQQLPPPTAPQHTPQPLPSPTSSISSAQQLTPSQPQVQRQGGQQQVAQAGTFSPSQMNNAGPLSHLRPSVAGDTAGNIGPETRRTIVNKPMRPTPYSTPYAAQDSLGHLSAWPQFGNLQQPF